MIGVQWLLMSVADVVDGNDDFDGDDGHGSCGATKGHRRDSSSDAKVLGCGDNWSDNGSEPSTRACHAKKLEHNSEIQKSAMGGHEKLDGERADGLLCKTADGDTWHELAANGVQWRRVDGFDGDDGFDGSMASMAAMVAQERTDV